MVVKQTLCRPQEVTLPLGKSIHMAQMPNLVPKGVAPTSSNTCSSPQQGAKVQPWRDLQKE